MFIYFLEIIDNQVVLGENKGLPMFSIHKLSLVNDNVH